MSPAKSLPPPNRLPAKYVARSDSDENIIDAEEVEPHSHLDDDDWSIADIFANLWPDDHRHNNWSASTRSGETTSRPPKNKSTGQGGFWHDFTDRAAKPLQDELDDTPQERQIVWALIRDPSGWYIYLNHNYRKLITVTLITLAMLATGKIPQAIEMIFKLFF
jgi:hypothetical protein